jgi:Phosphodiester glycosidase
MKRRHRAQSILFLALFLCANGIPSAMAQDTKMDIYKTPEYVVQNLTASDRKIATSSESSAGLKDVVTVSSVSVDPVKNVITLVAAKEVSTGGSSLPRFFHDERALAVINGGFLESRTPATPAGFLQVGKQLINDVKLGDAVMDGVLCFSRQLEPQSVVMAPLSRLESMRRDYSDCTQAGPLLIFEGKPFSELEALDEISLLGRFSTMPAERSFVALTKSGKIILGVTTPVSLFTLRKVLLASEDEGGFGAVQATALTGRSTAGLIAGDTQNFFRGNIETLLPSAIVVRN